jgi:tripartite-type tricarboxylate transporter receptor subunit TctC
MTATAMRALCIPLLIGGVHTGAVYAQGTAAQDAANFPVRPLRVVVPAAPGGGTDIIARLLGQGLQEAWGQPVVIDNRGGGGGIPGVTIVAKHSAANGYTMLLGSNGHLSFAPAIRRSLPFDPQKDLTPVSLVASQPFVWVIAPSVPAATLQEFIAHAKARPGVLRYGSGGSGTASHLGTELLMMTAGISLQHVPYKGTGPGMTALLGGEIQALLVGLATVLPYVKAKSDKLRVLAVSGAKRSAVAPELPTAAEAGLPGFEFDVWYGMVVPGGTPRAIVSKANAEIVRLLATPVVRERFVAVGLEPLPSTSEEFRDLLRREIPKWHEVARKAKIQLE